MKFVPRFDVRLVRDGRVAVDESPIIRRPEDSLPLLMGELSELSYERAVFLALNTKNHVIALLPVSSGSINASIIDPKSVFQRALLSNAVSILLAHNHPSGDPTPSPEDIQITKRLIDAGAILDLCVIDHIILGYPGWYSFREHGLM